MSRVDSFEYKPEPGKLHGKPLPRIPNLSGELPGRLVERGVHHTLLIHGVEITRDSWDDHGNVKGGATRGATDDFGLRSVSEPILVRNVHATILDLLGLDDEQLR